jgi:hypothetical protein
MLSGDDFDALDSFFLLVGIDISLVSLFIQVTLRLVDHGSRPCLGEEILDFASRQRDLDADRQ